MKKSHPLTARGRSRQSRTKDQASPPEQEGTFIGIDEAGCGSLAGPVVAAAVQLGDQTIAGVTDSKKMSPKRRLVAYEQIRELARYCAVGLATHFEVDSINILQARLLAMQRAVLALNLPPQPDVQFIVDGLYAPSLPAPAWCVVGADSRYLAVSAASVVAKVYRDRLMQTYDKNFPQYGFARHKGYPTQLHKAKLAELGLSPIHRRSYQPCATKPLPQPDESKNDKVAQ